MAFTPVSELGTDQWSVLLPEFVDTSKIGVDFDRLSMISRVGCFSGHVSIRGFSGETSQYQPMIVGDDNQGSAYAGAGSVKQASLGESEPIPGHELRYFYHRQAPLTLRVNMSELQQRIQHSSALLRDPKPWAGLLDKAISRGLETAAWEYCVRKPNISELFPHFFAQALATINGTSISEMLSAFPYSSVGRAIATKLDGGRLRDVCYSLTPAVHPDRALLVSGLTRALKLVKPLR